MTLTPENFRGPWAGLPIAWTDDDRFDEETYRQDIANCCRAGVPGVYTGGTTGEFYALEWHEFAAVTRATISECRQHNVPCMIGCTSTYTNGAVRRAEFAAEQGADAIQIALPFWLELADSQIVPFLQDVAAASPGLAFSIYDTKRARRVLSLDEHRAIKRAVPTYTMVKATAGSLGAEPSGCESLAAVVNVFAGESLWWPLGRHGVSGGCSSMVYWNPRVTLAYWSLIAAGKWDLARPIQTKVAALFQHLRQTYSSRGFTDTAFDRLGGLASGFLQTSLGCRKPYPHATRRDVEDLRIWYAAHFPEMLDV